jgi:hypothetical protein
LLLFRHGGSLGLGVFNSARRCGMLLLSTFAVSCPEHARLENEYQEARDRMRSLVRLRQLTKGEERQLVDRVAMAIARMKEHEAEHGCRRQG